MKVTLKRLDDAFHFEARNEDGNTMQFDAGPNIGGHNKGVRPMQTLLMALGGCSAIDIISILNKQRIALDDINIEIDGEREAGKEPSLFETIHVNYYLTGNADAAKAKRAVDLSMEKYCSVAKTLEKTAQITYSVFLNNEKIN